MTQQPHVRGIVITALVVSSLSLLLCLYPANVFPTARASNPPPRSSAAKTVRTGVRQLGGVALPYHGPGLLTYDAYELCDGAWTVGFRAPENMTCNYIAWMFPAHESIYVVDPDLARWDIEGMMDVTFDADTGLLRICIHADDGVHTLYFAYSPELADPTCCYVTDKHGRITSRGSKLQSASDDDNCPGGRCEAATDGCSCKACCPQGFYPQCFTRIHRCFCLCKSIRRSTVPLEASDYRFSASRKKPRQEN